MSCCGISILRTWWRLAQEPGSFIYTALVITTGSTTRCFTSFGSTMISPAGEYCFTDSTASLSPLRVSRSHTFCLNANLSRLMTGSWARRRLLDLHWPKGRAAMKPHKSIVVAKAPKAAKAGPQRGSAHSNQSPEVHTDLRAPCGLMTQAPLGL